MIESDNFGLSPVGFFAVAVDCYNKPSGTKGRLGARYILPDLSSLSGEEVFAQVALGWASEGLYADITVQKPFEQGFYPDIQRGDSVELFIDTRDIKTAGFNSRFCHHFYVLAKPVDGKQCGEITRFRTEDIHEWCDPAELKVTSHLARDHYAVELYIPAHCLHGYDPEHFDRLGFTYRVNRLLGDPQHFSITTGDYQVDQQPSLWSSLRLIS